MNINNTIKNNLILELDKKIKKIKKCIFNRALTIKDGEKLTFKEKNDLLKMDTDNILFINYSNNELKNHNFNLGMYYAYKIFKKYIK